MTLLEWIKDVRVGCKKIIEIDIKKIMKLVKGGNLDKSEFHLLFSELRDNERDDALLSLIQRMLEEEIELKNQKEKIE